MAISAAFTARSGDHWPAPDGAQLDQISNVVT